MQTRRAMLTQMTAAGLVLGSPLMAQDRYDQAALLGFDPLGQITLAHYSDLRGMVAPHYLRPAAMTYGPDRVPYLTGEALRIRYGVGGRAPMDVALTSQGFDALAQVYGPMGGVAHLATILRAIRSDRPGALVLDGGGADLGLVADVLKPDARTFDRANRTADLTALAQNASGNPAHALFERGDAQIAVIGLADPHLVQTGFDIGALQDHVTALRGQGAAVVVLLSQLGFEADRALAAGLSGVDVILSGRSGYALPEPEVVGETHIIASGTQGRFVSRVDIAVQDRRMNGLRHRLIPVFSDLIAPDAEVQMMLNNPPSRTLGTAGVTLYHQDTFSGTWEALIAAAMIEETGTDAALLPPLRAGPTVLAGQPISARDIAHVTTGAQVVKRRLSGPAVTALLERAAHAAFAADPFARETTRMMRAGGLGYTIAPQAAAGARISDLVLQATGAVIAADRMLDMAIWEPATGAPLAETLTRYISRRDRVKVEPAAVTVLD